MKNIDPKTVEGFGDEWVRFDQSGLAVLEHKELFDRYFSIFPWHELPENAEGFDLGCGSAARACSSTFNITDSRGAGPNGDYVYNDPNFVVEDEVYEETVYFRSAPYEGGDPSLTD